MKRQGVWLSVLSILTVLSVLCVLTAFSSSDAPAIQEKDFAGQPTYKVTRVIDGDTVELLIDGRKTTVRMVGVDTPETVHPQKPVEHYGKEASMFTKNLLKGEEVYIEREPGNTVGKYGLAGVDYSCFVESGYCLISPQVVASLPEGSTDLPISMWLIA